MRNDLECFEAIPQAVFHAVGDGKVNGLAFVQLANSSADVFDGIGTIAELLMVDSMRCETEDAPVMTPNQTESLLRLIRASADAMSLRIAETREWAIHRLEKAGGAND